MCQKTITPKDISIGGIIQLFEQVNNEGMISITVPAGQLKIADNQKISMTDTVNHLAHQIFMFDNFISHRIKSDRKHYKNSECSVFWNTDGSVELSFNLAKMICLPCRDIPLEIQETITFLSAAKEVMQSNDSSRISVSIYNNQVNIEFIDGEDSAAAEWANQAEIFARPSKTIRHLLTEITSSRQGLSDKALRITEEHLFHIFSRPNQNYLLRNN